MSNSVTHKEMMESMTKEEIYEMWLAEAERRRVATNENIRLKQEWETACRRADKYRRFWREKLKER